MLGVFFATARAADIIPVEEFARTPKVTQLALSPDGQNCVFLREIQGAQALFIADVTLFNCKAVDLGAIGVLPPGREVAWHQWVGTNRLVTGIRASGMLEGTGAIGRDGKDWTSLSGPIVYGPGFFVNDAPLYAWKILHASEAGNEVLMLDERKPSGEERLYPHVVKVNTVSGASERVVANPGRVTSWLADREGVTRLAISRGAGGETLLYRASEQSSWDAIAAWNSRDVALEGFSADGRSVYLTMSGEEGRTAFYRYDIGQRNLGDPLLALPGYDVNFSQADDYAGAIWSPAAKKYVGYKYVTDRPGIKWFDSALAEQMESFNEFLSDTFNLPVSFSNDGRRMLILARSDCEAGSYYLFDQVTRKSRMITRVMPALKRDAMAPMKPVEYAARDGLSIRGYLTLPLGRGAGNLPLVVLLHDGPRQRDVWGFDPLVQLLASRGCAVLQVNYRGSVGYGRESLLKGGEGQCEVIQQDIEDATRWAIASKIADPKHIAIMGAGFGGYSALYALGKTPELYSCGVSIGAVSDWAAIFTSQDDPEDGFSRWHWLSAWGDAGKSQEALKALSLVNTAGRISSPLLVIHGRQDRVVPLGQAKRIIAAMERAGRKVDSLFIPNEGHEFCTESGRLAEYKAIEAFLAKHLGTAATPASAGSGSGDKKK